MASNMHFICLQVDGLCYLFNLS